MDEPSIGDHAIVGDTRTAALCTSFGTIDWMCVPRFDGDPVFGSLVDAEHGGSFTISFRRRHAIERSYLDGSTVLQTTTSTATGTARTTEAMVADVSGAPLPQTLLVRRVECLEGSVEFDVSFNPRLGLPGRPVHRIRGMTSHEAVICEWGSLACALQCDRAMISPSVPHRVELRAGETTTLRMSVADRCPVTLVSADTAMDLVRATDRWWREWSCALEYDGPYRDAVVRSLITLRLLTYSPSGAPVAAPTTSLPEAPGAGRNWDYRYAWPRDASIGLVGFLSTGEPRLAQSFMHWLLHSSRLSRPRLHVLYDLYGRRAPDEREVDVTGYRSSTPVRVGNGATNQHQLDIYGWVVDAASLLEDAGRRLHGETWRAVAGFADFVAKTWRQPDAGVWEVPGDPAHYVHSKLMAWLALDRIARIARGRRVKRSRSIVWERERDEIASWVHAYGIDSERNALVWKAGSREVDAALLLLPVLRFEPPGSPLVSGTIEAIRRELEVERGLLLRYPRQVDGLAGSEGAFLPCSFWLVQALARVGQTDEATELFETLLSYANDVGLWSEEIDPSTKEPLGNFPQAFTHATLVQAGLALRAASSPRRQAT